MRTPDGLWPLIKSLEQTAPPMNDAQRAAFRIGMDSAGQYVASPAAVTLSGVHREGLDTLRILFGPSFEPVYRPHFEAGFASLLVHAGVPLDALRGRVEGWT